MGRPGLTGHRKFLRLAQTLRSKALARGVLELLWDAAYERGEPVVGDSLDVEVICDWQGPPGHLVKALVECGGSSGPGFIKRDSSGRLEVHDFWVHAPDYVSKRAKREAERVRRGVTLSEIRAAAGRAGALAKKARRQGGVGPARNPTLENHSGQEANGQQVAFTPSPPPFYKQTRFASGPPVGPAPGVVAVEEKMAKNFSLTTTTTPSSALEERERSFLDLWNLEATGRGRSPDELPTARRSSLGRLLDQVHEKNPDSVDDVLSWLVGAFLDDETFNTRSLDNLLKPSVWGPRLEEARARLMAFHRRQQISRRL